MLLQRPLGLASSCELPFAARVLDPGGAAFDTALGCRIWLMILGVVVVLA